MSPSELKITFTEDKHYVSNQHRHRSVMESTLYDDNMLVAIRYGSCKSLNRARSGCEELQVLQQGERELEEETG